MPPRWDSLYRPCGAIYRSCLQRPARRRRTFTTTARRHELLDVASLPARILPQYKENPSGLLSLQWPEPPRNVLIVPKLLAPHVTESAVAFARHIVAEYPNLRPIFERGVAEAIHESLPFPIYTTTTTASSSPTSSNPDGPAAPASSHLIPEKTDLVVTLGGDGTILRAASLFSLHAFVPPILAFSMGTLGFLGEWKFHEYKRAWREVYMSGSGVSVSDLQGPHTQQAAVGAGGGGGGSGGTPEFPQLAGRAELGGTAVVEDEDAVEVGNGAQAVGDDKEGCGVPIAGGAGGAGAGEFGPDALLDQRVRGHVDGASRLVEDHDAGARRHRPR